MSRVALRAGALVVVAAAAVIGCGDSGGDPAGVDATADVQADALEDDADVDEPVTGTNGADCEAYDAGDDAWVKRATPLLLGRLPEGTREVRVLTDLVGLTDRASVALALMEGPGFVDRWTRWLLDEVQVNRLGPKAHDSCFDVTHAPEDRGELAAHVAATAPDAEAWAGGAFTMLDLLRSALWADDLSVFYRGELFAMMARPATYCGNTPIEEMEATRRREFGAKFAPRYTHRTIECMGCHNSVWAVTDHPDPALDRHWPLPGYLEAAMYKTATGAPDLELFSAFRFRGVLSRGSLQDESEADGWPQDAEPAVAPWGVDEACGLFVPRGAVGDDPLGYSTYLAGKIGDKASVWDVEERLRQGVASLAETGVSWEQTDGVDGASAFAYLLAHRIAGRVWEAMMGAPLTMGHGFARNPDQHARLLALTETLITSGWSLRQLLAAIVTDPMFNPPLPDSCPEERAYALPPVLQPFSTEEADPARRGNGPGDLARRDAAWVLLDKTAHAMGWPRWGGFPLDDIDAAVRLRAAGAFISDSEPGFAGIDFQSRTDWEILTRDCLPSFDTQGDADDWISALVEAGIKEQATFRDLAAAIRDRLLLSPTLDATEVGLVEQLLHADSLDLPLHQVGNAEIPARRYCGVLLSSPWFLLAGVVPPPADEEPSLVLSGDGYGALCEQHAAALVATGGPQVTCSGDGASL